MVDAHFSPGDLGCQTRYPGRMKNESIFDVGSLAWDNVAARLDAGAAALLPIGAGAKTHGFHLPMNTDQIQAEWLARRIAAELDVLVWPTLTYGHYPVFVRYAGSCSLQAATFKAVVMEIIQGIVGFGPGAVLVLDTGISTLKPVAEAIADLSDPRVHHLRIHDGPHYREAADSLREQSYGSHADELETSRMLAIAPDRVDMTWAAASPSEDTFDANLGPLTPDDPSSPNYSESGSFGDPTLATPVKGAKLIDAMPPDG